MIVIVRQAHYDATISKDILYGGLRHPELDEG